jgi:hypothetical protein
VQYFRYERRSTKKPEDRSGINNASWMTHKSYGKPNDTKKSPYLIANEWICGNLAQYLRLEIPPFTIMESKAGNRHYFTTLAFCDLKLSVPDVIPHVFVKAFPEQSALITLFDIWIANPDRHRQNIFVDDPSKPSKYHIFDHESALLGNGGRSGIKKLHANDNKLGIERHLLAPFLEKPKHVRLAIEVIQECPDRFIESVCQEMTNYIPISILKPVTTFLLDRKRNIEDLVKKHSSDFPRLKKDLFS